MLFRNKLIIYKLISYCITKEQLMVLHAVCIRYSARNFLTTEVHEIQFLWLVTL